MLKRRQLIAGTGAAAAIASFTSAARAQELPGTIRIIVVVPPGVTELDVSAVPAQLQALVPPATDFDVVNVRVVDLASATSYDAARQLPEWQLSYPIESVHTGAHAGAAFADGGEGSNIWEPYSVPY